jgi:hypothetical protein
VVRIRSFHLCGQGSNPCGGVFFFITLPFFIITSSYVHFHAHAGGARHIRTMACHNCWGVRLASIDLLGPSFVSAVAIPPAHATLVSPDELKYTSWVGAVSEGFEESRAKFKADDDVLREEYQYNEAARLAKVKAAKKKYQELARLPMPHDALDVDAPMSRPLTTAEEEEMANELAEIGGPPPPFTPPLRPPFGVCAMLGNPDAMAKFGLHTAKCTHWMKDVFTSSDFKIVFGNEVNLSSHELTATRNTFLVIYSGLGETLRTKLSSAFVSIAPRTPIPSLERFMTLHNINYPIKE